MAAKILIMEDSRALLKQMEAILVKQGYEVEIATDGRNGLQKAFNNHPNLVLVDLMMPEVDGFEVIKTIKSKTPELPTIAFSAHPAHLVESKALALGAVDFMQKPLKEATLLAFIRRYLSTEEELPENNAFFLPHEEDQPYLVQLKACYICGYDNVNVFKPRPEALQENWNLGIITQYHNNSGFQPWNHLRTMVSVCPSCLFSSIDDNDFATERTNLEFPYKPEAKRILARNISTRKKILDNKFDLNLQFTNPNRKLDLTIKSFLLAERSANGLMMGDKDGVYCDLGTCIVFRGVLQYINNNDKNALMETLREALNIFLNQLKVNGLRRSVIARAYYFIISLHIALCESIKANEMKVALEKIYTTVNPEDTTAEENIWNERLQNVWTNGIDLDAIKNLELW